MIDLLFFQLALFDSLLYISHVVGLSHMASVYFCFTMKLSCVVVHQNNYFVANDNIKAEN